MLTRYINGAMERAIFRQLEDDSYFGEIPSFDGLWGNGPTIDACRADLHSALEEWIVLGLRHNDPLPEVDGDNLTFEVVQDDVPAEV